MELCLPAQQWKMSVHLTLSRRPTFLPCAPATTITDALMAWFLPVCTCQSTKLVECHQSNKKLKWAYDRIAGCLCYLHAKADLDRCSILWFRTVQRKTSKTLHGTLNVGFRTCYKLNEIAQLLTMVTTTSDWFVWVISMYIFMVTCRTISASAEFLVKFCQFLSQQ